mgnify:CR=1 FL=1
MGIIAQAEVEKFMKDSGVSCDKKELTQFFTIKGDRKVVDLVAAGKPKKVSMPSGGGGGKAASGGAVAVEAPKEEEKKEEVEDVDMGGLFGDEDDY